MPSPCHTLGGHHGSEPVCRRREGCHRPCPADLCPTALGQLRTLGRCPDMQSKVGRHGQPRPACSRNPQVRCGSPRGKARPRHPRALDAYEAAEMYWGGGYDPTTRSSLKARSSSSFPMRWRPLQCGTKRSARRAEPWIGLTQGPSWPRPAPLLVGELGSRIADDPGDSPCRRHRHRRLGARRDDRSPELHRWVGRQRQRDVAVDNDSLARPGHPSRTPVAVV
jgi:hypothetical protein